MTELETQNQIIYERQCMLAHEVNNGLGVIAGHCELMSDYIDRESDASRRLRAIVEIVHRLSDKINRHECRMSLAEDVSASYAKPPESSKPSNGKSHTAA